MEKKKVIWTFETTIKENNKVKNEIKVRDSLHFLIHNNTEGNTDIR